MQDFEKLGAFYLGRRFDPDAAKPTDDLVLYDSKDLTTHGVIIGMTGSGKTGLGISLLEEAALDHIPVIAIDPKGDLGNILLTFPNLSGPEFEPWINRQEAEAKGLTPSAYAAERAETWKKGLAAWGQDGDRIRRLREAADFAIYTPGSTAGMPVSVLRSFVVPPAAIRDDRDLFRERIQTTATSILALLGLDADPITSREHILIANVLQRAWTDGRDLDLPQLIAQIQSPPFQKIGVMEVDQVFPAKDRLTLAMQLNNLLAAPGFEAWLEGVPLDASQLLYGPTGKPRVSVLSIAHLGDAERMFFVSMLLNEVIGWMRQQPGTGTLRALLYMDEIYGYMPPVQNPPSKQLFLTLLKQARAYGLGVVVATQNPVDLDYKALSNAGTWFIGRLQTERDKARLMDGLEGASAQGFDRAAMEARIAGLGNRVFLLHNVHEDEPVVFQTRWAMSYLAGPFTREQVRKLGSGAGQESAAPAGHATPRTPRPPVEAFSMPPSAPPDVPQLHIPGSAGEPRWVPHLLGVADVSYSNAKLRVDLTERVLHLLPFDDGPVAVDWSQAEPAGVTLEQVQQGPPGSGQFDEVPSVALKPRSYADWTRSYARWLKAGQALTLVRSAHFRLTSAPGESERDFRIRLQQRAREDRDIRVEALRQKYAAKIDVLQEQLRTAEQRLSREEQEAGAQKLQTAVSFGTAILGAVLGRKKVSVTTASRVGTAARGVGRMQKAAGDVDRAGASVEAIRARLAELEQAVHDEIGRLEAGADAQAEALEQVSVKPKAGSVHVHTVGLAWVAR
jgi:hypothetical protein